MHADHLTSSSSSSGHVVVIGGVPRAGKTTVAAMLAQLTGCQPGDTSLVIYERIAADLRVSVEDLMRRNKSEWRAALISTGDELCSGNPAALAMSLIARGVRIVAGVRKPDEIQELRLAHQRNLTFLWVEALDDEALERLRGIDPELAADPDLYRSQTVDDNTNVAIRSMADLVILNITMGHLWTTLKALLATGAIPLLPFSAHASSSLSQPASHV